MADGRAGNGGARPGAGRKLNLERHRVQIDGAGDQIARSLEAITSKLILIAGGEGREEEWVPAGSFTRKDAVRNQDGSIWTDDKGKPCVVDVQIYPDLKADEWVCVKRKPWKPDPKAMAEAWDRLCGKAMSAVPPDPESINLREALLLALKAREAYVDPDDDAGTPDDARDRDERTDDDGGPGGDAGLVPPPA